MIRALLLCTLLGTPALAADTTDGFRASDTAHALERGQWSVGVFAPLRVGLGNGYEVRGHPLLFLVSPNVVLRKEHLRAGELVLSGEYGLSMPSFLFSLTRGYLFASTAETGWILVPRAGVVGTLGEPARAPWSFSVDAAFGWSPTATNIGPRSTYAPLETLLAPALGGVRLHAGVQHDRPLTSWLRGRVYGDVYGYRGVLGPDLTVRAGAAMDLAIGAHARFTLGAVWWNSNQHRLDPASGRYVRSNELYPTLDFVWGP